MVNPQTDKSRQIKPQRNAAPFCLDAKISKPLALLIKKQMKLRKAKSFHINIALDLDPV